MAGNIIMQIEMLMSDGKTLEEACAIMDTTPFAYETAKKDMVSSLNGEDESEQLISKFKARAVNVLIDIAENGENEAARARAAAELINYKSTNKNGVGLCEDLAKILDKANRAKQLVGNITVVNV